MNYLCMNYSRPTPLPCKPIVERWKPRWWNRGKSLPPRFVIHAWWPPATPDFKAYADAGFNMALTGNALGTYCQGRGGVTHDELFEVIVATSDELSKLGILTVFETENDCNSNIYLSGSMAYGNRTGGIIEGRTNITARAPAVTYLKKKFAGHQPFSRGKTIPELEWITKELQRRGKFEQFAGIALHDDTLLQTGETLSSTSWLKEHVPTFLPFVNQVNPGPETLGRAELLTYSNEEYAIQCPNSTCTGPNVNATAMAIGQLGAYAANAWVDARFGLHSWPLFNVGAGNGRLDNHSVSPDAGRKNVRSDSLVRFMVYSAVAYGAKGINYYCWGGGVWYFSHDLTKPGRPTPTYQTVVEANADVGAWGDELIAGGFEFSGALHTGHISPHDGSATPSDRAIVVTMSDDLLVGVFVPGEAGHDPNGPSAYLFVVDKRVSGELAQVPARNVTLTLHPSVQSANVALPGRQGPRGFDELRARHGVKPAPRNGIRRRHYEHVARGPRPHGDGQSVVVTIELVGGGGGLVRLVAASGKAADLLDACFGFVQWTYPPGDTSLSSHSPSMDFGLKQASWEYDSFPFSYRPYEGLELTAGRSFEDGEQTSFILGASMRGAAPPAAADEAKTWAWAGYNVLSLEAPSPTDLASYGNASAAVGAVLDAGYPFGFFVVVEPSTDAEPSAASAVASVFTPARVVALNRAFRCHARWAGLMLGSNVSDTSQTDGVVAAGAALRTYARGSWLLPFVGTPHPATAIDLGDRGVPLPMVEVPPFVAGTAVSWAQEVAARYEPLRQMLAASYRYDAVRKIWGSDANAPFVASVDACASESDSMLRWSAFSALAYGARGLFWRGAGRCAPLGSPKFGLLASINRRIAQWGNTFVASARSQGDFPGGGYNVTKLWSTGFALPYAVAPAAGGASDMVQSADLDVLVASLGTMGIEPRTTLIYVVDQRVDPKPGGAPPRELTVQLRKDVQAMQPLEGDCAASRCQCGMSLLGSTLKLRLPGGSGQLVALVLASDN